MANGDGGSVEETLGTDRGSWSIKEWKVRRKLLLTEIEADVLTGMGLA